MAAVIAGAEGKRLRYSDLTDDVPRTEQLPMW